MLQWNSIGVLLLYAWKNFLRNTLDSSLMMLEPDKLGSESSLAGRFGTWLGGLLGGVVFPLVVNISAHELCDGDQWYLSVP